MSVFNRKPKPTRLQSLDELDPMLRSGKPVLLDFMQVGCAPCKVMDGIVNELAVEYGDSAHIVKVDVGKVPGAAQVFKVRSTPTFVLLGRRMGQGEAIQSHQDSHYPGEREGDTPLDVFLVATQIPQPP